MNKRLLAFVYLALSLVYPLIVTGSDTDTSNGDTRLPDKVVESPYIECSAGDVWGGTFYLDRDHCTTFLNVTNYRNGEIRSVGEYSPLFDQLTNSSPQSIWGLTACGSGTGNALWTRTFAMGSSTLTNFISWKSVWFPRKADNSLDTLHKIEVSPLKFCESFKPIASFDPEDPTLDGDTGPYDSSPIVIDLDGNGVKFSSLANGGWFDLNNDGVKEQVPRIVSANDYWLVWDLDENGIIPSGKYMFGNHSLIPAENGYDVLRVFNESGINTVIDAQDKGIWSGLKAWLDNGDFITQPGELIPLGQLLNSLSFTYQSSERKDRHMYEYRYRGDCERRDGGKCKTVDVFFPAG